MKNLGGTAATPTKHPKGNHTMKIRIKECYGEHIVKTSSHRADDLDEVVRRAVVKHYGKGAVWMEDIGLRSQCGKFRFGQAFRLIRRRHVLTNITGRFQVAILED